MKTRKIFAAAVACVAATSVFALSASAYTLDKDLRTGWSISTTIPGSEFESVTEDSVITITYTADPSVADMEGHAYWVIKPMINDAGWPLMEGLIGLTPSDDGSSYTVDPEGTQIQFSVPADLIEHLQIAGMAIMGHAITLGELTVSNDITLDAAAPAEEAAAPAEEAAPATTTAVVSAATDKGAANPRTGVEDIASAAAVMIAAGAVALTARSLKKRD